MKIQKIVSIVFSPAGHTERVLRQLTEPAKNIPFAKVDLSDRLIAGNPVVFESSSLCFAGVPSFGGRVPVIAAERLAGLEGNGAPVVAVVAYGNRAYDDTLLEWKTLLQQRGFRVIAAVAAVAEHSICPQFAAGRPNAADCRELQGFGKRILASVFASATMSEIPVPGNVPYRAFPGLPFQPSADINCIQCGLCAKHCPVGAIPVSDPSRTEKTLCVSCMRCVSICPEKARSLAPEVLQMLSAKLRGVCSVPHNNELFLA